MDIPPTNQFVSLEKMEAFIERYPEDADKWLEFLDDTQEEDPIFPYKRRIKGEDLNQAFLSDQITNLKEPEVPITHFSEGCLYCKKSWNQTKDVPCITMICGHKYHTICFMYGYYNNDRVNCIVDDCDINTWDYVKQIGKIKSKNEASAENILFESITKRKDFKEDLKEFKGLISDVTKKHATIRKSLTDAKNELINKHIFSINQIQKDTNELVKLIKNGEQMEAYKTSLRVYRKKAKSIFRKYHLSFRDLQRRNKLNVSWRLRWILERHRESFGFYRLGLRINPGKKIWKDPLTAEVEGSIHSEDIHSDLESDGSESKED